MQEKIKELREYMNNVDVSIANLEQEKTLQVDRIRKGVLVNQITNMQAYKRGLESALNILTRI